MSARRLLPSLPRGIFAKLLTVFLAIGILPLLVLGYWVYDRARGSMTEAVIEHWLARISREIAVQIDQEIARMRDLAYGWSQDDSLARDAHILATGTAEEAADAKDRLLSSLANSVKTREDVDLVLVVGADDLVLADALNRPDRRPGAALAGKTLTGVLADTDPSELEWMRAAASLAPGPGNLSARSWHLSYTLYAARGEPYPDWENRPRVARAYSVGFAAPLSLPHLGALRTPGTLVVLFNCGRIQRVLDHQTERFRDQREESSGREGRYATGYPFLFESDGNTVVAHRYERLVGTRLVEDHHQEGFHDKIRSRPYGSHHYEYPKGTSKIAGFAACNGPRDRGFGWTVVVGIDDQDIYSDVRTLRTVVVASVAIAVALVLAAALFLSLRLTRPILALAEHTRRIASGDLEARIRVDTRDEIAVLGQAFNTMAEDLRASNARLILAEKDAAWREMARQVAHVIKNPLTPIMLSAQQVQRAYDDRHPELDEILRESMASIITQCNSLKKIASDFTKYARLGGGDRASHRLTDLVSQSLKPYQTRDGSGGVQVNFVDHLPPGVCVHLDREDLQRVLLNLINNAMESMNDGGVLTVTLTSRGSEASIAIADTGRGIPKEHMKQLFEPSFSTRTGGTGLGLAIARKLVEEYGGRITVESEVGVGTTMTITLPAE